MNYFPIYLRMDSIKVLVVGGGNIALEKLEKIINFTSDIEVIGKEINSECESFLQEYNLKFAKRAYKFGDINRFDLIVVAVDDLNLQSDIFDECKKLNKLCNSVDSVDYCNFIFPAFIKEGGVTIAISTSGKSPAVAKYLKTYLKSKLPSDLASFLDYMDELRKSLPKGVERMKHLSDVAKKYFEKCENEK